MIKRYAADKIFLRPYISRYKGSDFFVIDNVFLMFFYMVCNLILILFIFFEK